MGWVIVFKLYEVLRLKVFLLFFEMMEYVRVLFVLVFMLMYVKFKIVVVGVVVFGMVINLMFGV